MLLDCTYTRSYLLLNYGRYYPILKLPHQSVCLLGKTQSQDGMRQDSRKMCKVSLVYRQQAFRLDGLV